MATHFLPELDNGKNLEDILNKPEHIEQMNQVHPKDDYSAWGKEYSIVKLMNVKFDAEENVVNWKTKENRDKWFDAQNENVYKYKTNWDLLSLENFSASLGKYQGNIIVHLPLEEALGYNYVYIQRYVQPTENDPASPIRENFFFFITGVESSPASPNATSLLIELDAWTEYSIEGFKTLSGDLDRGHWAMDKISTEDYLSNPIDSEVNLYEPEPNLPEIKNTVSHETFTTPYQDPIIVIASTTDLKNQQPWDDEQKHVATKYWWRNYADYKGKYKVDSGYQGGYLSTINPKISDNGKEYDNGGKPVSYANHGEINQGQNITNLHYYILELNNFDLFMNNLRFKYPQIYKTLQAMFVLPRNYVIAGNKFDSVLEVPLQECNQDNSLHEENNIKITPEMFNFSTDLTKLYTKQFCNIEVSNLNGASSIINIEDTTGNLELFFRCNSAFPFLKFEGFINGVGGSQQTTYNLKPLNVQDYKLFNSNWEKYRFTWNIPTYAIYEDAKSSSYEVAQKLERDMAFADLDRDNAYMNRDKQHANSYNDIITDYDTGVNTANNTKKVGDRSNDTALANATASANTAKDNGNRSNDTALANATDSATTEKTNGTNTTNNTFITSNQSADNSLQTSLNSIANIFKVSNRIMENRKSDTEESIDGMNKTSNENQDYANNQGILAGAVAAAAAAANIAVSYDAKTKEFHFSGTGGTGDAGGAVNKALGLAVSEANISQSLSNGNLNTRNLNEINVTQTTNIMNNDYSTTKQNNINDRDTNSGNAQLNNDVAHTINQENKDTNLANINRTFETAISNANRSHSTTASNIAETYATAIANANRTHATTAQNLADNLATTLGNLGLIKSKNLTNMENEIKALTTNADVQYLKQVASTELAYVQALNREILTITANTGEGSIDAWGQRGIDVRINRISKADEIVVTNEFKRYGYRMPINTWIKAPTFDPIQSSYVQDRHYSYWEFRNIYAWSTEMSETSKRAIINMLINGLTIWDNPENVGQYLQ